MRHRTLVAITTTALLAALATGCTAATRPAPPVEPPTLREQARFTTLEVPPEMMAEPGGLVAPQMAGDVLGHEWALAAGRATPQIRQIDVWWPAADGALEVEPDASIALDDSLVEFDLAGDATAMMTVGSTWGEGHRTPFAKTSADGVTWTAVTLPGALDGSTLSRVTALGDGEFAALGTTPAGEIRGVVIAADGSTEMISLADVTADDVRGVAGEGPDLMAITAGPGGPVMTAHHSADGGLTWTSTPMSPAIVDVAGVVRIDGQYAYTGAVLMEAPAGATQKHHAGGASTDGEKWSTDGWRYRPDLDGMQADSDQGFDASDGAASWFGEPVVAGGRMTALISTDSHRYAIPAERFDGAWETAMLLLPDQHISPAGVTAPTGEAGLVTASGGGGLLRVTAGTPLADDVRTLVDLGASVWAFRPQDGADDAGPAIQASKRYFTESEDGGWTSGSKGAWFAVVGDAVVAADPPFPALPSGGTVLTATSPENVTLAVSSGYDDEAGFVVNAAVAAGEQAQGELVPLPSEGFATATHAAWTGGGWTIAGLSATNASTSRVNVAALWSSPDGVEWTRDTTFDAGPYGSVSGLCVGTGGTLVVGSGLVDGRTHATTWHRGGDGAWTATTQPAADSRWSGCTALGDTVLAELHEPSGTRLMSIADDGTLTEVLALGTNTIGSLHRVGGGLAAPGTVSSEDYSGPVLWLSPDGLSWQWVPVPASAATAPGTLAVDADSVIVFTTGAATAEAWRVDGVSDLLSLIDVASPAPSTPAPSPPVSSAPASSPAGPGR